MSSYSAGVSLPSLPLNGHSRHKLATGKGQVLEAIRMQGPIPRTDLAEVTGLSRAAISKITSSMVSEGLLQETAYTETGHSGRPVQPLEINDSYSYTVGVQIRDEVIEFALMGFAGKVHSVLSIDTERSAHPREVLQIISASLEKVAKSAGVGLSGVAGVGIALPGIVDQERGVARWIPGYDIWHEFPVQEEFQKLCKLPVSVRWRAYAAATAEMWWGKGRQMRDFVYLNVDNGVGMASIIDKWLLVGHENMAGMLGHIPIPGGLRRCACGNRGCLQTLISIPALIHFVEEAQREGVSSVLTRTPTPSRTNFADLVKAAELGDRLAVNIFDEAAGNLAIGIATIIHILNPRLIVIGGELAEAKAVLTESLQRHISTRLIGQQYQTVELAFSDLHPSAATVGAATDIMDVVVTEHV